VSPETRDRLFGYQHAFDDLFTCVVAVALAAVLVVAIVATWLLWKSGRIGRPLYNEILLRWKSWLWLILFMGAPILLGAAWVMAAVAALSLLCYSEYARATDLAGEKVINAAVVLGILVVTFAVVDNYPRLFFATATLTVGVIAVVTIPQDRPQGYLRRVALGVLGFLLFGYSFGYVGYIANDPRYRPVLILLLLAVELNDVFAFCVGKPIGGPKLLPHTSPGKTVAGSVGALVLTTVLVFGLGHAVFTGTPVDHPVPLLTLGAGISVLGQLGDLLVSSVKRDVGIKDTGTAIPGHGGLLDRFDSLVLVPPAFFHFLALYLGPFGSGSAERIITGN
jgi:phosphatidate cytidylyltransferase